MLSESLGNITKPKKVAVIQVQLMGDEDYRYSAAIFSNSGGKFVADFVASSSADLSLGKEFASGIPYLLHIFGKGVVEKVGGMDLLGQVISGSADDDGGLVYQHVESEGQVYTSFARKEAVESVLASLRRQNIFPVELILGSGFQHLYVGLSDISGEENLEIGYGYNLVQVEGKWTLTRMNGLNEDGRTNFLGEDIAATSFRLYLITLLFFIRGEIVQAEFQPAEVLSNKAKFHQQQKVKIASVGVLLLTFLALLINSFVFSSISEEHTRLSGELQHNRQKLSMLDSLERNITQLEQNIPGIRGDAKFPGSFIFDRLGATLPRSIALQSAELNPVSGKIHDGEEIKLKSGIMIISGTTGNSGDLSAWIDVLKKEEWVTEVELVNLQDVERVKAFVIRIQTE